jgi:hypothetical protein
VGALVTTSVGASVTFGASVTEGASVAAGVLSAGVSGVLAHAANTTQMIVASTSIAGNKSLDLRSDRFFIGTPSLFLKNMLFMFFYSSCVLPRLFLGFSYALCSVSGACMRT